MYIIIRNGSKASTAMQFAATSLGQGYQGYAWMNGGGGTQKRKKKRGPSTQG
jgi:hypothetical protein